MENLKKLKEWLHDEIDFVMQKMYSNDNMTSFYNGAKNYLVDALQFVNYLESLESEEK